MTTVHITGNKTIGNGKQYRWTRYNKSLKGVGWWHTQEIYAEVEAISADENTSAKGKTRMDNMTEVKWRKRMADVRVRDRKRGQYYIEGRYEKRATLIWLRDTNWVFSRGPVTLSPSRPLSPFPVPVPSSPNCLSRCEMSDGKTPVSVKQEIR